jgi:hypothetical protein
MESCADTVIVSAFGRGNWLAQELARQGWQVTLVDVSEQLGAWSPEDIEGPFGFFEGQETLASQRSRIEDEGISKEPVGGFTLWLPEGPLEFRSSLTPFLLRRKNVPEAVESYLRKSADKNGEAARDRKSLVSKPFAETWLAHFAHQLASPVIAENHLALQSSEPSPLFARFFVRDGARDTRSLGLRACLDTGVVVRSRAKIKDVRLSAGMVDVIEVEVEEGKSGAEQTRSMVWMLSSLETRVCPPSVHAALFPKNGAEPSWYWARFRVGLRGPLNEDQIPGYVAVLEDPCLPWTHSNFMILRSAPGAKAVDAWLRIPYRARNDRGYFEKMAHDIERTLGDRFPQSAPQTMQFPLETKESPAPFVVWDPGALERISRLRSGNLFFASPEEQGSLDWLGGFRAQALALGKLQKLKERWLAAEAKEARRSANP